MDTKEQSITTTRKKLGFTTKQSSEMVGPLMHTLTNYQMLYHKFRNFHWNVEGSDFFELHAEFENDYTELAEHIDIVAERIRVFNHKPMLSMQQISEVSEITDIENELSARDMVLSIVDDYNIMHNKLLDALDVALSIGDNVTEQMITDLMRYIEKRNWMYSTWAK
jgi:starvation-inducible DNA-binding protein